MDIKTTVSRRPVLTRFRRSLCAPLVLLALGLGATAVLIGRPHLWGLAAAGQAGVDHVLKTLDNELDRVMGLAGVARVSQIVQAGLVVRSGG